ncbi:MAG: hypothetical protein LQ343_002987 [Gyalolechia ehrenbergii]|nr:MAG: hypothetical protein LQ343_002987 [Gyalolechia ehrenbergii]
MSKRMSAAITVILCGQTPSIAREVIAGLKPEIEGAAFGVHLSEMRAACKGDSKVPWLELDQSKSAPSIGFGYGAALVKRVKSTIAELEKDGKMGSDGVYFY